jgi:hypothetical protein
VVQIAYDVRGVDHDKTESAQPLGPIPPKGVYTCWVSNIELVKKKGNDKEEQLKFTFRVAGGPHQNYPFYTYVDPSLETTKWKWDQILVAFGLNTRQAETGKFNSDTYVGKGNTAGKKTKVRVSFDHSTYTNDKVDPPVTTVSGDVKGVYKFDPTKDEEFVPTGDLTHASNGVEGGPFEDEDLYALGEAADGGEASAIAVLTAKAEEWSIDPDTIKTWVEVAEEITSAISDAAATEPEPEPAQPVKAAAKKAAGATKKAAAAPEPELEPEPEPEDEVDWDETGEFADAEDQDSIDLLTAKAEELGLDINAYGPWADLATAIKENLGEGGAKVDYDAMDDDALRAELTTRGLKSNGPRNALMLRLRKDDGDPFAAK